MIYINGRFLTQPMTGVERYAYNMCKAMAEQQLSFTIVCPQATIQACYDISHLKIVHYGRGNSHLWEQCILPFFFLNKKNYVVHNPRSFFLGKSQMVLASLLLVV